MTIVWGAACVDGVVIAADSMLLRYKKWPDGAEDLWAECSTEKLQWLGDRLAFVMAGSFVGDPRPENNLEPTLSIEAAATQIYFEMHDRSTVVPELGRLVGTDVLVAGGPKGARPELLLLCTSDGPAGVSHRWIPAGHTVGAGCLGFDAPGQPKSETVTRIGDHLTVAMAVGLGIAVCHAYVRDLYRGVGRTRLGEFRGVIGGLDGPADEHLPPVAFPLQIAVITADAVRRYEVRLPDDITAEDGAPAQATRAVGTDG